MNDTDPRLWHPWLRINRVLRVMLQTRWSAEAWSQVRVEFRKALALGARSDARGGSTSRRSRAGLLSSRVVEDARGARKPGEAKRRSQPSSSRKSSPATSRGSDTARGSQGRLGNGTTVRWPSRNGEKGARSNQGM